MLQTFSPSKYQIDIFEHVKTTDANLAVCAVAGSGKTTTMLEAMEYIESCRALFCAFNKSIAMEIQQKTRFEAKTIHSKGAGVLCKYNDGMKVDNRKYDKILKMRKTRCEKEQFKDENAILMSLIDMSRLTLTDLSASVDDMLYRFSIDERLRQYWNDYEKLTLKQEDFLKIAREVLLEGEQLAKKEKVVDFTDMLYLPYIWQLPYPQYMWLFVDECQDLNQLQIETILKMKNDRVMVVGDPHQAIYGFAGAAEDSFDQVSSAVRALDLPLSISYRCPKSHLELAREIVPGIEAAPGAIEGDVISDVKLIDEAWPGDLVICRANAPLFANAFALIAEQRPVAILGRDIAGNLVNTLKKIAKQKGFIFNVLEKFVYLYFQKQLEKLTEEDDSLRERLIDKRHCLLICARHFDAASIADFENQLRELFRERDKEHVISFATIHKAKGLEARNVFILDYNRMPLKWKKQQLWQFVQECNLKYVALTRAKEMLYLL